jgi:hypothetical protein
VKTKKGRPIRAAFFQFSDRCAGSYSGKSARNCGGVHAVIWLRNEFSFGSAA